MKKIKKILIIDDDAVTAFLHKRLLEHLEVADEIAFITDPYLALQYVQQQYVQQDFTTTRQPAHASDLIFLDINMPGMDGFQFMQALESLTLDHDRVCIVMLTTSHIDQVKPLCRQSKAYIQMRP